MRLSHWATSDTNFPLLHIHTYNVPVISRPANGCLVLAFINKDGEIFNHSPKLDYQDIQIKTVCVIWQQVAEENAFC